jgi:FkbM family methyltransferase
MKFYSQSGQDKFCYNHFFKGKKNGVFVEVGADDGLDRSNTIFFEKLGWTGMCIEASPSRFKNLAKNRECICENYAITNMEGKKEFLDINGYGKGLSGLVDKYDPRHINRINREIKDPRNKSHQIVSVDCNTLSKLLEKHNITHVDFCSIDTEGNELEILKTIDFKKYNFNIFTIENNYKTKDIKEYMTKQGFVFVKKVGADEIYRNKDFNSKEGE